MDLPRELYPFESHELDLGGIRYHYLDEGPAGQGAHPVVMLHGNPTWSFHYRDLVRALRGEHRCIVPDHVGCGLSDKPGLDRYDYTLARRVEDLGRLIDHLDLGEPLTLVAHDWGGMIGMAWAVRHPERIARLVLLNTAAFHMPTSRPFHWQLALARDTALGAWLVTRFNAFAAVAARVCCTRRRLPPEVRRGYLAPYDTPAHRIATLRFVQDIPLAPGDPSYELVSETEAGLPRLAAVPKLICWGERDFVFDRHFLDTWQRIYPDAEVRRFPDCGHYVLEDAGQEIAAHVRRFLATAPAPGST